MTDLIGFKGARDNSEAELNVVRKGRSARFRGGHKYRPARALCHEGFKRMVSRQIAIEIPSSRQPSCSTVDQVYIPHPSHRRWRPTTSSASRDSRTYDIELLTTDLFSPINHEDRPHGIVSTPPQENQPPITTLNPLTTGIFQSRKSTSYWALDTQPGQSPPGHSQHRTTQLSLNLFSRNTNSARRQQSVGGDAMC